MIALRAVQPAAPARQSASRQTVARDADVPRGPLLPHGQKLAVYICTRRRNSYTGRLGSAALVESALTSP